MQVSWIDPDHVRSLAEQLLPTRAPAPQVKTTWNLPAFADVAEPALEPLAEDLTESFAPPSAPAAPAPAPAPTPSQEPIFSPVANLSPAVSISAESFPEEEADTDAEYDAVIAPPPEEIDAIRQRLQALRERALQAGILPPVPSAVPEETLHESAPVITETVSLEPASVSPQAPAQTPATAWETGEVVFTPAVASLPTSAESAPGELETTEPQSNLEPEPESAFETESESEPESTSSPELSAAPTQTIAAAPGFVPSSGSIAERLNAFVSWVRPRLGESEIVIVDDHGGLLWGPRSSATLILSAMMAWSASMRGSAVSACEVPEVIRQSLSPGKTLSVMPCATRLGMIQVAVARPVPLSDAEVTEVRQTLFASIESEEDNTSDTSA